MDKPLIDDGIFHDLQAAAGEDFVGELVETFADEGRRVYGRIVAPRAAATLQQVFKEPVGPVAAFTPWNFPINQVVRKLSAALATSPRRDKNSVPMSAL